MNIKKLQPLVSIITVTRNCESTIARTLDSVSEIKNNNIEYIIIDGESTDTTLDIIKKYDGITDVLVSEKDSGIYNAMNKGAELARGKYILFLNGDDYILADGFKRAMDVLREAAPDILSCQSEVYAQNGTKDSMLLPSLRRLFFFNSIPHLSTFVSANLQKKYKFREIFKIAADYDLFLRMYRKGHHFMLSELVTSVHYRGGFSNNLKLVTTEIKQIRKDNLGLTLYFITRWIEWLNKLKNVVFTKKQGS